MGKPGPRAEPRRHDHCGAVGGEHLREISTNVTDRRDQLVRNNLQSVTHVSLESDKRIYAPLWEQDSQDRQEEINPGYSQVLTLQLMLTAKHIREPSAYAGGEAVCGTDSKHIAFNCKRRNLKEHERIPTMTR